jgi:TonB family protein
MARISSPATSSGRTTPPVHDIAGFVAANAVPPPSAPDRNLLTIPADEFDRIEWQDPVYPRQALRDHTRGWVELEFTILADGKVRDVAVVDAQPTGTFERAATEALSRWLFRPRIVNGQAVPQRSSLTMRFDVDE